MNKPEHHARILGAYLFRLKMADVAKLKQVVDESWQLAHVVGGASAAIAADKKSQIMLTKMIENILPSDLENIEELTSYYAKLK